MDTSTTRPNLDARRNIEAIYDLSPMQQGMLFHSLYGQEEGVYFEQLSCTLRGELDAGAFHRAWQQVVDRHSILRTSFSWKSLDRMLQVVQRQVQLPMEQRDWRNLSPVEQKHHLQAYLEAQRRQGFDLSKAPLMRLGLMQIAEDAHYFVWNHHHILMDGWSLPILLREVFTFYEAFRQGRSLFLPAPRPYKEYITWLKQRDVEAAEAFWRRTLAGFTAPTALMVEQLPVHEESQVPWDGDDPAGGAGHEISIRLTREATVALEAMARSQRVTLSTAIQGAWALLLSRYSGEQDVLFGATVAGRPVELVGADGMVGIFINTLPVRVQVRETQPVGEWLRDLQNLLIEARQYEYSPLVQIQEWSDVPRGTPLFESILVFENYPVDSSLRAQTGSLRVEDVKSVERTNYPLTVVSGPSEELLLKISYDRQRFDAATIERMLHHLRTALESIAADANQPVSGVEILTATERQQLLVTWNQTAATTQALPVHRLFEAQVLGSPDAVAVAHAPGGPCVHLTYGELNRRANQLARHLQGLGVAGGALAGLAMDRSPEMLVGLFAILKAGGAYVPLDPVYPPERLQFMLTDAKVQVLVTTEAVERRLSLQSEFETKQRAVCVDRDWQEIATKPHDNLPESSFHIDVQPEQTAYVIYTSGSTGLPKGVMVRHDGLTNHAQAFARKAQLTTGDRMLQFISLSFDAAGEEIYPTLISGAALVIPGGEREALGAELIAFCEREKITILHLVASVFHALIDGLPVTTAARNCHPLAGLALRLLTLGGDAPDVERLRWFSKLLGRPIAFLNLYGPTETTIASHVYPSTTDVEGLTTIPIGRPVANAKAYVLDAQLQPVPVGVPGELYIGGRGVGIGYLNRPGRTAELFVPNPLAHFVHSQARPGRNSILADDPEATTARDDRLYRTGDLVRYLPNGNLEFLGRRDDQVKIRGFRVEPGEIERVLLQHADVQAAAVVAHHDESGLNFLAAYVVSENDRSVGGPGDAQANLGALKVYLRKRLPNHMVPSIFIPLEELPRTPSGKVDRKRLSSAAAGEVMQWGLFHGREDTYVPPRSPLEEMLVELWSRVLRIGGQAPPGSLQASSRIGVYDSFFELGGHSLLATQLQSRVRDVFQVEVPLAALFEDPTVAGLAAVIDRELAADRMGPDGDGRELTEDRIEPIRQIGDLEGGRPQEWQPPLSFAQQRLWFLDQLQPDNLFYNIPVAVRLRGTLDVDALSRTLNEIVRRHEALRTTLATKDGQPVQVIAPSLEIALPLEDLTHMPAEAREEEVRRRVLDEARQPFDLATGPLLRARLFKLSPDEHIASVTMHHIVSDGWSMSVLVRELTTLYSALSAGRPSPLPELPIQYADYAQWQRKQLSEERGGRLENLLTYWRDRLAGSQAMLELPTDRPRPGVQTTTGDTVSFWFSAELMEAVRSFGRRQGATLFMTLLAAFQALLYRYSGQVDVNVGTPVANRNRSEIESLIGFFVNTLVIRTDLGGNPPFQELVQRVRAAALGAFAHQELPFEMLVEALQPQRALSHTPLFQVAFGLQNTPVQPVQLPNLQVEPLSADTGSARFDLTLVVAEQPDGGLGGSFEYNTDLFDRATIERMIGHLEVLLQAALKDPGTRLDDLPLLTPAEGEQLLITWNDTALETPQESAAHELFEAWAERRPELAAATFEGHELSYEELNRRANQLAYYLRRLGVGRGRGDSSGADALRMTGEGADALRMTGEEPKLRKPEAVVGIAMERSLDMVVAIMGVLKAGAAYLPLDPSYPPERLAFMMADSGMTVLLTHEPALERLSLVQPLLTQTSGARPATTVRLDAAWDAIGQEPTSNLALDVSPENLAYVIYTSGSTGQPKGAMLRHRGLSNLAEVQRQAFDVRPGSRILQFSPFSFDASVWEMIMALGNGACLCLARQEVLASGPELLRLMRDEGITTVTLPPSVLAVLDPESLPDLEVVVAAGEKCTVEIVQRWGRGRRFFDAYGPTETTVCASMALCDPESSEDPTIGRPIGNCQLYVLDRQAALPQAVPLGVPGQLAVAGVNVGRGYLQRPGLTAETFVPNPFNMSGTGSSYSERLYLTGDLVRYLPDGNLEFLGRIDHQVKVRGFRIELGEIEAVLRQVPQVRDAVVMAQGETSGTAQLVGFVLKPEETELGVADLRATLRQKLPEYMVPALFHFLDAFPLSPSGKVDRAALRELAPSDAERAGAVEYVAPRTETEAELAAICQELLGVERVGVHDNFFDLGGHSLLATQFTSRVREAFLVELPLRTLFEHPTVAELAPRVDELMQEGLQADGPESWDRISELLAELDELSDEEAEALLQTSSRAEVQEGEL